MEEPRVAPGLAPYCFRIRWLGSGPGVEVLAERVAHVAVGAVDVLRRRSDALLDHGPQDPAAFVEADQHDRVGVGRDDLADFGVEAGGGRVVRL